MNLKDKKIYKKIEYLVDNLKESLDRQDIYSRSNKGSCEGAFDIGKETFFSKALIGVFSIPTVILLIIIFLIQLPFVLIVNLIIWIQSKLYGIPFVHVPPIIGPTKKIGCINNKIKIEIRHREHAPPHFHVIIDDDDYPISIMSGELLQGEIKDKVQKTAIKEWYDKNRALLIKTWNESRPSDCPVGRIDES